MNRAELNQLYSLRYGTIPVVTDTGGLANTVTDCTAETLADATATGFFVHERTPEALDEAIGRALHLRHHSTAEWEKMVLTAMRQDWSWRKSATQYSQIYAQTAALK